MKRRDTMSREGNDDNAGLRQLLEIGIHLRQEGHEMTSWPILTAQLERFHGNCSM